MMFPQLLHMTHSCSQGCLYYLPLPCIEKASSQNESNTSPSTYLVIKQVDCQVNILSASNHTYSDTSECGSKRDYLQGVH